MSTEDAVAEQLSASERATLDQLYPAAPTALWTVIRRDSIDTGRARLVKTMSSYQAIARKFNVDDAKKMLHEHIDWRKQHQVDTILEDYEVPTLFLQYCPGGFVECGLGGQPVYITPLGSTDIKGLIRARNSSLKYAGLLEAAPRSDLIRHLIYILETQEELKRRISLQNGGRRIDTMYVVADMEGFSFWQLSSIEVVSAISEAVRLYEANYPEILEEAFVINEGWRDVLASRFDVERLPAHWGGRLRGPDGDGRCTNLVREFWLCMPR
ncbi:hypothetical protein HPB49_015692 [Dermacentor silvarum]|uniref:Uncharacterized protein n=1 Tax=Dermacentor silvarum TaxID=543639 RepID=A0ACB8CA58_DERSI|nr:hypothetical protein HPB49_015692 [Dermacentor silvarum]